MLPERFLRASSRPENCFPSFWRWVVFPGAVSCSPVPPYILVSCSGSVVHFAFASVLDTTSKLAARRGDSEKASRFWFFFRLNDLERTASKRGSQLYDAWHPTSTKSIFSVFCLIVSFF